MSRLIISLCIFLMPVFYTLPAYAQAHQPETCEDGTIDDGIIEEINTNQSALRLRCENQILTFAIESPEIKASLKTFGVGDRVAVFYSEDKERKVLKTIAVKAHTPEIQHHILVLPIAALILWLLFKVFLRERTRDLIIGMDNRYSKSKFQIVVWFFVLITTYLATLWFRLWFGGGKFFGGVNIPSNLLLLSGLSALTFVAAKGITQENAEAKTSAAKPRFPQDLFENDKQGVDMGDFQMIIVTLLAVVVYIVRVYTFHESIELHSAVTLPDVDTTILATFGLGQGAYLVKKYVGDTPTPPAKPGASAEQPVKPDTPPVKPTEIQPAKPEGTPAKPHAPPTP